MKNSFLNKNILITGGAGQVGSCLAKEFSELGANVIILDHSPESVSEVVQDLGGTDKGIMGVNVDLSAQSLSAQLEKELGGVTIMDHVIHSAAYVGTSELEGWIEPFEKQSVATWEAALRVNLTAPFVINQFLLPKLQNSQAPTIVHISSIYGVVGPDFGLYEGLFKMGNPAAYAASKGGLDQLTRWLACTLGPYIRVNSIILGGVERGQDERFVERYCRKVPLKRMAQESDVVGPVKFLSSEDSRYVTGHTLHVDGGYTIM